jgi:hypothetical protein
MAEVPNSMQSIEEPRDEETRNFTELILQEYIEDERQPDIHYWDDAFDAFNEEDVYKEFEEWIKKYPNDKFRIIERTISEDVIKEHLPLPSLPIKKENG